jgi:type-F conjugative transfer system pilin assembly protein TrbC
VLVVSITAWAEDFCPIGQECHEDREVLANKVLQRRQNEIGNILSQLKVNLSKRPKLRQKEKEKKYQESLNATLPKEMEDKSAEKAYKRYQNNKKQQGMVERYTQDIWASIREQIVADEKFSGFDPDTVMEFIKNNKSSHVYDKKHLLFFVSSSIPEERLKEYVTLFDGNPYVAFVLRGPVGNATKIMPTIKWMSDIFCKKGSLLSANNECNQMPLDINPKLYKLFGINRVPALVYIPDPTVLYREEVKEDDYYVYYGGISPVYALEQIQLIRPDDEKLVMLKGWFKKSFF